MATPSGSGSSCGMGCADSCGTATIASSGGASSGSSSSSSSSSDDGAACCWICLQGGSGLVQPCACPRASHPRCLARWQLQQAGRPEERACRFCGGALPDWRGALGGGGAAAGGLGGAHMSVALLGGTHRLTVFPGPLGKQLFKDQMRALLGYAWDEEFQVAFDCRVPGTGERLQLSGFGAYDAAVHCAAAAAAARRRPRGGGGVLGRLPLVEHWDGCGAAVPATYGAAPAAVGAYSDDDGETGGSSAGAILGAAGARPASWPAPAATAAAPAARATAPAAPVAAAGGGGWRPAPGACAGPLSALLAAPLSWLPDFLSDDSDASHLQFVGSFDLRQRAAARPPACARPPAPADEPRKRGGGAARLARALSRVLRAA